MTQNYQQLLERAARICSSSEKCSSDIREKLRQWGMKESETDDAIDFLISNQFIDDLRYAKYYAKDKFKFNKWGKIKISYTLKQKRIGLEHIEEALNGIDQEEYNEVLDRLIEEKIKTTGSIGKAANKAKVYRYIAQKGFSSEEFYGALERLQ